MSPKNLARRALWLFLLTLGFYLIGVAIVLGLLWVPWAEVIYEKQLGLAGIVCAVGATWVGLGLVPRFERRQSLPPTDGRDDPRLTAFVREIASRLGHPAPDGIHLLLEANAVAARYWKWPAGSTTIVGIGLPLLASLDREALGSVIAHEFGHHLAGDVALGPWVHRARRSVGRAIGHLDGSSFFLHLPFVGYGEWLLRSSLQISRAQELHADSLAAMVAGTDKAAHALSVTHAVGPLWSIYWETEVAPVLAAGWLPPLLEGFRLFQKGFGEHQSEGFRAQRHAAKAPASPLDSHPSLAERLAALGVAEPPSEPAGNSLDLLDDLANVEARLVVQQCNLPKGRCSPITWDEVTEKVWIPFYRSMIAVYVSALSKLTPSRLSEAATSPLEWAPRMRAGLSLLSPEAEQKRVLSLFAAWLVVALVDAGFRVDTAPGRPVRAVRAGVEVEPFLLLPKLATEKAARDEWSRRCAELGLA